MDPLLRFASNPFIEISFSFRILFSAYVLGWRIFPSLAGLSAKDIVDITVPVFMILFKVLADLLLLLPFLVTRFAGAPVGWLHPLVMPTAIFLTLRLIMSPEGLLLPFFCWEAGYLVPKHVLLEGVSSEHVHVAELKLAAINFLSIVFTYIGFALFGYSKTNIKLMPTMGLSKFRLLFVFSSCLFIVAYFLHKQGGIVNHMASLAIGRFDMREVNGQFLILNKFLPFILLIWYLHKPDILKSPLFAVSFIVVSIMQFVVTGSRSGLFAPIASLLIAWMYINRRIPAKRALLLGVLGVLVLGALGDIRGSGRDGEIDISSLTNFDLLQAWEASQDDIAGRALNPDLAVMAVVPKHKDYIYGSTYLAAIGFFVPRAIWEDKPRGGGAHAAAIIYEGEDSANRYSGAAYPISGVVEAYWSFDVFGVVVLFILFGLSLRLVVALVVRYPTNEFHIITLILFLIAFNSPSTDELVATIQMLFMLVSTAFFVRTKRDSGKDFECS